MENDLRRWIRLLEGGEASLVLRRLTAIALKCNSVEQFIRKTDGEDVLYRGHSGDRVENNSFMTDYVGHAAQYGERVDAFAYNPNDVLYYDDSQFDELRIAYSRLSDKQLAEVYQVSLSGNRFAAAFGGTHMFGKIKEILRGKIPYSKICGKHEINDLLVPLLQKYARDMHHKNIIGFFGNDYADYGGQNEFVVGDISKLVDLREFFAKVQAERQG